MPLTVLSSSYRAAVGRELRPVEPLSVSDWAERYRVLGTKASAEPGPWRNSRTPYLKAIQDALGDKVHRRVVVVKNAQSGGSECGRNALGRAIDQDPGPALIVFPSEESAKECVEERVIPMVLDSPQLRRHWTGRAWDLKRRAVVLDTMTIYVAWAGSAQALASRPIRYVYLDEISKYPPWRGKEADPVSLATVRTATYGHRSKVFVVSTPTTAQDPIMRAYEACPDRREYRGACPRCGSVVPMTWEHVTWDGIEAGEYDTLKFQQAALSSGALEARFKWPCCDGVFSADADRGEFLAHARWVGVGAEESDAVGFKIPGLASPWQTFTGLACEHVTARIKGASEIQHFYNSLLGEPFLGVEGSDLTGEGCVVQSGTVVSHMGDFQRGKVPPWTTALVAGADSGYQSFHWVVRAFGPGFRSRLVDWGVAHSFEELRNVTVLREFPVEETQARASPSRLYVDSGGARSKDANLTEAVYRFSRTDPGRIFPCKGYGASPGRESQKPVQTRDHTYRSPEAGTPEIKVTLTMIEVKYFKDLLAAKINEPDRTVWELPRADRDYTMQVCSEHKVLTERRVTPGGKVTEVWRWVPKASGLANHYWDAEVYALACAYAIEVDRPAVVWEGERAIDEPEDAGSWWSGQRRVWG